MREYELDLNSFEKWLKTQGASERTIKTYIDNMNAYARKFETFSYANNRELVETSIETEKSASTINSQTSAMNSFTRYLISKGEPLEYWIMSGQKSKQVQFLDDILSMVDYEFLLKKAYACEEWIVYLYARIAGTTGMRLCEMLQVKREHIEHGCVDLYGKGVKRRRIYFPKTMRADVLELLDKLGLKTGYVFSPKFNGEKKYGSYGRYIQGKLAKFGEEECEFNKGLVHSHGSRHFFAKEFVRKNPNISLLADLLGHSNLNTTRIYLKLTSREQAEVIDETVTW